ncbi:hypothetical protein HDV05_004473 [Chytridiales sp. JEL 0842]|nr:hypothetical protein HDV05_004473 [Chytridiales sp. JEL 0842]
MDSDCAPQNPPLSGSHCLRSHRTAIPATVKEIHQNPFKNIHSEAINGVKEPDDTSTGTNSKCKSVYRLDFPCSSPAPSFKTVAIPSANLTSPSYFETTTYTLQNSLQSYGFLPGTWDLTVEAGCQCLLPRTDGTCEECAEFPIVIAKTSFRVAEPIFGGSNAENGTSTTGGRGSSTIGVAVGVTVGVVVLVVVCGVFYALRERRRREQEREKKSGDEGASLNLGESQQMPNGMQPRIEIVKLTSSPTRKSRVLELRGSEPRLSSEAAPASLLQNSERPSGSLQRSVTTPDGFVWVPPNSSNEDIEQLAGTSTSTAESDTTQQIHSRSLTTPTNTSEPSNQVLRTGLSFNPLHRTRHPRTSTTASLTSRVWEGVSGRMRLKTSDSPRTQRSPPKRLLNEDTTHSRGMSVDEMREIVKRNSLLDLKEDAVEKRRESFASIYSSTPSQTNDASRSRVEKDTAGGGVVLWLYRSSSEHLSVGLLKILETLHTSNDVAFPPNVKHKVLGFKLAHLSEGCLMDGVDAVVYISETKQRVDEDDRDIVEILSDFYGPQTVIPISAVLVKKNGAPSGVGVGTRLVFEESFGELDMKRFMNRQNLGKVKEELVGCLGVK